MSGLLDDIKTEAAHVENRCAVHRIANILDKDDAADFVNAVNDESINGAAIARALHKRGIDINPNGERIRVHRRGQCGCARG